LRIGHQARDQEPLSGFKRRGLLRKVVSNLPISQEQMVTILYAYAPADANGET